jgi:RNA polymerase sigma-70 factor (ECF subfamily)
MSQKKDSTDLLQPTIEEAALTPEEELIARVCSGDKACFHNLIRPYTRLMFATASSVLHNSADAEEAVQEAVLKVFLNLSQLTDRRRFRPWLLQIVVNEARMLRRKLRTFLYESIEEQTEDNEGDSVPRQFADWHDLPNEALERDQLRAAVRDAVDQLPVIYREVLLLIDGQRLSYQEVAEVLGVTVGVVKTRVHRARMRVQEQLRPAFRPRLSDHIRLMKGMNPWSHAKR